MTTMSAALAHNQAECLRDVITEYTAAFMASRGLPSSSTLSPDGAHLEFLLPRKDSQQMDRLSLGTECG